MDDQSKPYTGQRIVVRYNPKRCIHFAACVRGLPDAFDPKRRPWIVPDNADADTLAEVVQRCPTGALHFERLDDAPAEQPPAQASVQIADNGPLYLHGEITVQHQDGTPIVTDTRVALCRCGMSRNKPFCDGTHSQGFHDAGRIAAQPTAPATEPGPLTVIVGERGPYQLKGSFALHSADGSETRMCRAAALCRCGASQHKPFCDGTHQSIDQEIFK
ncbi:MAG TPA: CDGSH iron-sulfur domain-containing protein [Herpetosiphonaceae bacterium]